MADREQHPAPEGDYASGGHEPNLVSIKLVWYAGIALVGIGVLTHFTISGMYSGMTSVRRETAAEPPLFDDATDQFPGARVDNDEFADRSRMRRSEANALRGYAWVDERAGIARIPINRAKEMLLKKLGAGPQAPASKEAPR